MTDQPVIVVHGSTGSGKSLTVRKFVEMWPGKVQYMDPNPLFFESPYFFNGCTPETSLIVFDEVHNLDHFIRLVYRVHGSITVKPMAAPIFEINPHAVIVLPDHLTKTMIQEVMDGPLRRRIKFVAPIKHGYTLSTVNG